jgi:alpha-1,2-mannosyltransferase
VEAGIAKQHYYIYPPFFALLFVPLSFLSFTLALDIWLGLDLVLLGLFFGIYIRQRGGEITWPEIGFMGVAAFLEFLPLIWAMAIGQTSLIVLVLLAGTLWAWRRERDITGGLLLGIAIAIKLTPALFTVFFLWRGKRKLAMTSAAVFGAIQIISIGVLGWEPHRVFFFEIVPEMAGGTCYFLNQSLGAFFNRLLTDGDVRQVELVSSAAARVAAMVAAVALVLISAPRLRRRLATTPLADELQFGMVVILTLVISPISWTHHYLIALLPLLAVAGHLGRRASVSIPGAMLAGLALLLIARKPHADLYLDGIWRIFNSAALAGGIVLWFLSWLYLKPSAEVEE